VEKTTVNLVTRLMIVVCKINLNLQANRELVHDNKINNETTTKMVHTVTKKQPTPHDKTNKETAKDQCDAMDKMMTVVLNKTHVKKMKEIATLTHNVLEIWFAVKTTVNSAIHLMIVVCKIHQNKT